MKTGDGAKRLHLLMKGVMGGVVKKGQNLSYVVYGWPYESGAVALKLISKMDQLPKNEVLVAIFFLNQSRL